jgi:hypothetical protein
MKRLSILLMIGCGLLSGGCADPLEQRTTGEVGSQFKRGISGEGRLIPSESVNTPTGVPAAAETPPDYPRP